MLWVIAHFLAQILTQFPVAAVTLRRRPPL